MKMFVFNTSLFLILFMLLLSRSYIESLLLINIPDSKIIDNNTYIKNELNEINLIKKVNFNYQMTYGKILYQNPYKFGEELTIIADTDNIHKNDYVIDNKGFLGIVDKITKNRVVVKLLTSNTFLLQIKINDCYGLLRYENDIKLTNVNNYCNIKLNDVVYTSNLGYLDSIIPIGVIRDVIKDPNKIADTFIVKPYANLNKLNYVIILSNGAI